MHYTHANIYYALQQWFSTFSTQKLPVYYSKSFPHNSSEYSFDIYAVIKLLVFSTIFFYRNWAYWFINLINHNLFCDERIFKNCMFFNNKNNSYEVDMILKLFLDYLYIYNNLLI